MAATIKPMTWPERLVAATLICGMLWGLNSCFKWSAETSAARDAAKAFRAAELSRVRVRDFTWRKDGFGSVMVASFKVENGLDYDVKDVTLNCRVHGASSTTIGQPSAVVFDAFPAGKWKLVRDFNIGFISSQAQTANCEIVDFVRR